MKKIISLIASIAMLVSMVTSVSAADLANNAAPVVDVTMVEELSAEGYYDWIGSELPADEKAYLVDVSVLNVDLSNKALGKTGNNAKKRTGTLMMYAGVGLKVDNASNITKVEAVDGGNANATLGAALVDDLIKCEFFAANATQGAPEISNGTTTEQTTDAVLAVEFIVTAKGAFTITVQEPELKFTNYEADAPGDTLNIGKTEANHATWTVNGEEGSTITFGSVTPPPPVEDIIVANKMTLPSGLSWDVTINNYAPAKTYTATFTATGEADKVHDLNFSAVAEATEGASFGFAALLKLKTEKTNVELAVTKN